MPETQFVLEVPIDVSDVEDLKASETVSVAAVDPKGRLVAGKAKMGRSGKTAVKLVFDKKPAGVRLYVGPGTSDPEELPMQDSLELQIPASRFRRVTSLTLEPIFIKRRLWFAWRLWCRRFKVSGRITCPDGSPVPGAEVTAFDVDWCWWWLSKQTVGTTTTDEHGYYELEFIWCCAWRPWWWWHRRHWRLEPGLIDRIKPILKLNPELPRPPKPTPTPDVGVFERMLEEHRRPVRPVRPERPERPVLTPHLPAIPAFDPTELSTLRQPLLERLPQVEELSRLRIWPWYPWYGWRDCAPDLIFRVTQDCGEDEVRVLVDENFLQTRWNVGTHTTVDFIAADACCIDDTPQPEGDCLNLTSACRREFSAIGGNPTAAIVAPEGYYHPGVGDNPFGGVVTIYGDFGTGAAADYYQLQWYDPSAPVGDRWQELPPGSMGGFNRRFYGPELPAGPIATHTATFPVQVVDGRRVIESRQHFQANNGNGTWENLAPGNRWWTGNKTLLARWLTDGFFADGTYRLRIVSWELQTDGTLAPVTPDDGRVLGICGSDDLSVPHEMVLTIDNRIILDPAAHDDECGPGTVHICTDEPETRILKAEIVDAGGAHKADLAACSEVEVVSTDKLRVEFRASDVDGHLSRYDLKVTFGNSQARLLTGPGRVAGANTVALGGAVLGPFYSDALGNGAASPIWHGGDYAVEVPVDSVFEITCCYQLELRARKRTIVSCSGHELHRNLSERSFMIRR